MRFDELGIILLLSLALSLLVSSIFLAIKPEQQPGRRPFDWLVPNSDAFR